MSQHVSDDDASIDRVRTSLESMLKKTDDAEINYHIRTSLQLLEVIEHERGGVVREEAPETGTEKMQ